MPLDLPFQAVVLAYGNEASLHPFCTQIPICLLPVANRPLITYPLELLESSGFQQIIILASIAHRNQFSRFISQYQKFKPTIKYCVEYVPDTMGDAQGLKYLCEKNILTQSFFVIPGTLITDVSLHFLTDFHHIQDATVTSLFYKPWTGKGSELIDSNPKKKKKTSGNEDPKPEVASGDIVGIDTHTQRFVVFEPNGLIHEPNPDGSGHEVFIGEKTKSNRKFPFVLRKSLLYRYPRVSLSKHLFDAQTYLFSKAVIKILSIVPDCNSIRLDLIPYLVNRQFNSELNSKCCFPGQSLSLSMSTSSSSNLDEDLPSSFINNLVRCFATISDEFYTVNVVSPQDLMAANRVIAWNDSSVTSYLPWEPKYYAPTPQKTGKKAKKAKQAAPSKHYFRSKTAQIDDQSTVVRGISIIGDETVTELVTINNSFIGSCCQLGVGSKAILSPSIDQSTSGAPPTAGTLSSIPNDSPAPLSASSSSSKKVNKQNKKGNRKPNIPKIKISNSILMHNVDIAMKSTIDQCVIGRGVSIGEGCVLTKCFIGPGYVLAAGTRLTGAVIELEQ